MEEFESGKRIREGNETEESIMKAMKSESDYRKDSNSNEDDDKNQQQMEMITKNEECYGFPSSSKIESIIGKRLKEGDEIKESRVKKAKSEPDIKKDGESNEDDAKNQQQMEMITKNEEWCGFPSSSKEESIIGKYLRESDEINESRVKKMKPEPGIKKDGESNEDRGKNQQQEDMRTRKEEETHFLRLFTKVLNAMINENHVDDEDIAKYITDVKSSFLPDQTFHETDFTQWKYICAYLYRYASHGAGFARNRILNAIRNCKVVESALKKPNLRVICLGSGPGNDAVGLCSALSELQFPKSLKLTLIDKFKEWSSCIELAERFIEEENYGKVSELFQKTNVELSFIQTDLPGDPESDEEYFEVLGEADVIVMSKFFTSLDRSKNSEHEKAIIKSLQQHMKEDAVVLVNDEQVFIEERWSNCKLEYEWGYKKEDKYRSTALAAPRFRSNDDVTPSKLPIYVIVKNSRAETKGGQRGHVPRAPE